MIDPNRTGRGVAAAVHLRPEVVHRLDEVLRETEKRSWFQRENGIRLDRYLDMLEERAVREQGPRPFRRVPYPMRPFGRRGAFPAGLGRWHPILRAVDLIQLGLPMMGGPPEADGIEVEVFGFNQVRGNWDFAQWYAPQGWVWTGKMKIAGGHFTDYPLAGQSLATARDLPQPASYLDPYYTFVIYYETTSGYGAAHSVFDWGRGPWGGVDARRVPRIFINDKPQYPNLERAMPPTEFMPIQEARYSPRPRVEFPGGAGNLPKGAFNSLTATPPAWAFEVSASPKGRPVPVVPTGRKPPGKGEKPHRKVQSKLAAVGVATYKALDLLSESADVIDAVYEALPEDVRKRWEKGRKRGARSGDNYGQYGLNGADWKLEALWHNWHRLDAAQAVENILKNEVEDRIYGAIHKRLPVQAGGPGMEQQWRQFGKLMGELGF